MNRARTDGGRHAAPSGGRAAAVTGALVFVLTPWLSLGFGTPVVFLLAAVLFGHLGRLHVIVLWTATAGYTAAVAVMIAESDSLPGTAGEELFGVAALFTIVVGGLHALGFTVVAALRAYRPGLPRVLRGAPVERPAMAPGARAAFWLVAGLSGAVMVGVAVFGVARLVDDVLFERRHETTSAVVISIRETRTCLSNQGCTDDRYPTVAFTTARGESVRAETEDPYGLFDRDDYAVGRSTTVHYDAADPTDVRLRSGLDGYDLLVLGYLVAGAVFGASVTVRRVARRGSAGSGRGRS
jgi:hypothetical protein